MCVAFRGDSPVEYWSEEEPEEPSPFGLNEVNRRLAALGREPVNGRRGGKELARLIERSAELKRDLVDFA